MRVASHRERGGDEGDGEHHGGDGHLADGPGAGARLGDRADEQRERDGDDAHHGERRAGGRPAGPPSGDTEDAEERRDDPAPSLRDERCQGRSTEHHEHGEQLAAPATRQVQPAERDGAGQGEPDRRGHPAVAAGHRDHVEVGRGRTGGDEGHRRGPDDAAGRCGGRPLHRARPGPPAGRPAAAPAVTRAPGPNQPCWAARTRSIATPAMVMSGAGHGQHRGHRSLAAVPGHGGCGRRRAAGEVTRPGWGGADGRPASALARAPSASAQALTRAPRRERSTGPAREPRPRHPPGRARSGAGPGRCPRRTGGSWRRRSRTRAGRRRHAGSCPHHRARTRRGA